MTLGDTYKVTFADDTTEIFTPLGGEPLMLKLEDGSKIEYTVLFSKPYLSIVKVRSLLK